MSFESSLSAAVVAVRQAEAWTQNKTKPQNQFDQY
jgi:hypothetical protein